ARLPDSETAELRNCRTPKLPNSETARTAELRNGRNPKRPSYEATGLSEFGSLGVGKSRVWMVSPAVAMKRWHSTRSRVGFFAIPPRGTLRVIDAAEDFAVDVNRCFGLQFYSEQARRAAGSVCSNLIEGSPGGRVAIACASTGRSIRV